ncbi:Diphthamide biosynthesis protein 3 [Hondaea fermentalgiana]|uniref:Diphthamide biosynthesis protein 3 n=1 Tax=Hondaea fermentalgiana TaxID=2315210 RepID=A0A2R5GAC3_9STRA|nr:Diphthamide biosynthesis protein 3 [Hondaea fermentalgiana]|eukprot:GBG24654.1 Diphthamide biosynthesis protein 3 [Hondaea fermentalgiana]
MAAWDDIDLDDMTFSEKDDLYTYPCPCGDDFFITVDDLLGAEDLAPCPSCSLLIRVVYDPEAFLESIELEEEEHEEHEKDEDKAKSAENASNGEGKDVVQGDAQEKANDADVMPPTLPNPSSATEAAEIEVVSALDKLELADEAGGPRDVDVVDV